MVGGWWQEAFDCHHGTVLGVEGRAVPGCCCRRCLLGEASDWHQSSSHARWNSDWARHPSPDGIANRDTNSQNAALSASLPLYRPVNQIAFDQAQKSLEVAEGQLLAAEHDLIVRSSQAYFDVLAAQDTLTFVKAQKTAVAEQLAAAKRNFEVGTSTITDSREAQARFDLVVAQEIAAENDLRVKRLALDQLVGRSGTAPLPLAAPVNLPAVAPNDVAPWVAQSENAHPGIRQARAALDIAALQRDI